VPIDGNAKVLIEISHAHGQWRPVLKRVLAERNRPNEEDRRSDHCRSMDHQFSTRGFSTKIRRPSVIATSNLAVESRADALLVIVIAASIAVAGTHSTIAFNVLFQVQTIALVERKSPHSGYSIV
jgi:hypothetical protein